MKKYFLPIALLLLLAGSASYAWMGAGQMTGSVPVASAPTLVARWEFDSDLTDAIGSNDLTAVGTATYNTSTPMSGTGALSTSTGNNAAITDATQTGLDGTNANGLTIAAWVDYASGYGTIVVKHDGTNGWMLRVRDSSRKIRFMANATTYTSGDYVIGTSAVHVAVVLDAQTGSVTLYINGTETTSGGFPGADAPAIVENTADVQVGAGPAAVYQFTGDIDDVRIYNAALSSSEIAALYAEY